MKQMKMVRSLPGDAVYDEITSPVGKLMIITSTKGLHAILFDNEEKNTREEIIHRLMRSKKDPIIIEVKKQLSEYFAKKRKTFDLKYALHGTDFQIKTWKQLLKIPYGKTISYGEQATKIGDKNKARAVGMANGLNPIPIIIPCHRVIGSNGKLVGFGGGVEKKSFLLSLEQTNS